MCLVIGPGLGSNVCFVRFWFHRRLCFRLCVDLARSLLAIAHVRAESVVASNSSTCGGNLLAKAPTQTQDVKTATGS